MRMRPLFGSAALGLLILGGCSSGKSPAPESGNSDGDQAGRLPASSSNSAQATPAAETDSRTNLEPKESYIEMRLEGGSLPAPIRLHGKTTGPSAFQTSSLSIMASTVEGVATDDGANTLVRFTFSGAPLRVGQVPNDEAGFDIVVSGFPNDDGPPKNLSLRPVEGECEIHVLELDDDRVKVKISGNVSPTQMYSKHLVFKMDATIEHRFRQYAR